MKPTTTSAIRRSPDPFAGDDVIEGLRAPHKYLPCKLLYDARGAELFEQICTLDEYYPYRSELALLEQHLPAIAQAVGSAARVIEPGSGAGRKTRMLLSALDRPATYIPIDVSTEQLATTARDLEAEFAGLEVVPIAADYTAELTLPPSTGHAGRTLVFFPGSTIGNFEPEEARRFLSRFAMLAGPDALLVLGADANADAEGLLRAYDDAQGVTAAFDLNVLAHLNRTHAATFDLAAFMHRAVWDPTRSRIEMHLVSRRRQVVQVAGQPVQLERGEPIVTEHCYKHAPEVLTALLDDSGWRVRQVFADPRGCMRLWLAGR
ncbi:MAG TPA: L-histidine N(alpha)-methyltransferase [Kofleriaceae bacterium]|jgi:dimethylhistidine N-methyltransferase|nr:L-histidine N(alpha)-methyltransferase [Kofleriaceae bacterium]